MLFWFIAFTLICGFCLYANKTRSSQTIVIASYSAYLITLLASIYLAEFTLYAVCLLCLFMLGVVVIEVGLLSGYKYVLAYTLVIVFSLILTFIYSLSRLTEIIYLRGFEYWYWPLVDSLTVMQLYIMLSNTNGISLFNSLLESIYVKLYNNPFSYSHIIKSKNKIT